MGSVGLGEGLAVRLKVAGWVDASLVDVIGDVAFTVWFNYCDFKCPWCQNAHVVFARESRDVTVGELLSIISSSSLVLGYVQATGGEPTLQEDGLKALFQACKEELSVQTSLSTNGSRPGVIGSFLDSGLIDHLALDVKAPFSEPEKYGRVIGLPGAGGDVVRRVRVSAREAVEKGPFVELRTTFVPGLHTPEDILTIAHELADMGLGEREKSAYVIQQFNPSDTLMDPCFAGVGRPSPGLLLDIARKVVVETGLKNVFVRARELGAARVRP